MAIDVKFLGTGGVFDYKYGNSSALVTCENNRFLIDCGPLTYPLLVERKRIGDVQFILLTHLHGDHIGGLFQLILHLNARGDPARPAVILYPTDKFRREIEAQLAIWFPKEAASIQFLPLDSVPGVGAIDTTNKHSPGITSFSYYFSDQTSLVYYSGDIGDVTVAADFLRDRPEREITVYHELHHLQGRAHCHYRDVMNALVGYRVYGYHCDPEKIPADNTIPLVARTQSLLV